MATNPEMQFYEDQQNKQIHYDPNAQHAESMREEKIANILSQIDPDNLLENIEHRIRGEKKDRDGEGWQLITKHKKPISEEIVATFMSFLGSILNQSTTMSNFSNQEINNLMEVIIDWVKSDLVVNAETYGIEGEYTEYDRIGHIICTTCFTAFKRALNGQESRRIFKMMRVSESNAPQKKGGFAENFKFW